MKFVMSYSCGKDSTLALQKLTEQGHEPVGLLVMINEEMNRSWFHGADYRMLNRYSEALDIPLILCPSKGEEYHIAFEKGLAHAKELGAEMAGFGDIDIEGNRKWSEERCENAGLKAEFPLWQRNRAEIVDEIIEKGYRCVIKSINNTLLPKEILGMDLGNDVKQIMEDCGVDVCGENGEFHTTCVDGPVFKKPLCIKIGEVLNFGDYSVINIMAGEE